MFLRMKRARKRSTEPETPRVSTIFDADRISDILGTVLRERLKLQARIQDEATQYTTSLLDIYQDQHRLALDELKPHEGHIHLLQSKTLTLSCSLDGAIISFETQLMEKGDTSGITYYRVQLPTTINCLQRRQHHRVIIPGSASFQAELTTGNRTLPLNGYVSDLSLSGIGLILDNIQTVEEGQQLLSCTTDLPIIGRITFDMVVRHLIHDPQQNITRLGGSFNRLNKKTVKQLQQLIQHIDKQN